MSQFQIGDSNTSYKIQLLTNVGKIRAIQPAWTNQY